MLEYHFTGSTWNRVYGESVESVLNPLEENRLNQLYAEWRDAGSLGKEFIPLVEKQIELDNEIKELTKLKEDKTPLRLI